MSTQPQTPIIDPLATVDQTASQAPEAEAETTPRTTAEEFFHLLELARAELDIRKLYERPVSHAKKSS